MFWEASEVSEKKSKVRILILGAYKPKKMKERLEQLRNALIIRGYENTKLMMDFSDEQRYSDDDDIHYTKKSEDNIHNWAQILIFLFFKEGENEGVASEFKFTCIEVSDKMDTILLLHEKGKKPSTQVEGPRKESKIRVGYFDSDKDLIEITEGYCWNFTRKIFYNIR